MLSPAESPCQPWFCLLEKHEVDPSEVSVFITHTHLRFFPVFHGLTALLFLVLRYTPLSGHTTKYPHLLEDILGASVF